MAGGDGGVSCCDDDVLVAGVQVRFSSVLNPDKYVQFTVQRCAGERVVFDADVGTQTVGPGADAELGCNWGNRAGCKMFLWTVRSLLFSGSGGGVPRCELLDPSKLGDRERGMFASRFLVPTIVAQPPSGAAVVVQSV